MPVDQPLPRRRPNLYRTLVRALNLRRGLDSPEEIDADVRRGVEAVGTNLWVLMFAILIASVGLNVNSTAVIIGAMLISPLMGPIVGLGYGLALRDFELIRLALRNLALFTAISLATSTLYFSLSPLEVPGSELLARTSPTLWDVLIAFFGGAAGIIALTRHNISTVVPGVAIATALMPPLCTAGFALSQGRWDWFGGALYLYAINSVFIAYATLLFVKLMKLRPPHDADSGSVARARWLTAFTVIAMIVPSTYLAWRVVATQSYGIEARKAVDALSGEAGVVVLANEIDAERRQIVLTVAGEDRPGDLAARVEERLRRHGFPANQVVVKSASGRPLDVGGIKRELQTELLAQMAQQTESLRAQQRAQQQAEPSTDARTKDLARLRDELVAQHPVLRGLVVGTSVDLQETAHATDAVLLIGQWQRLSRLELRRVKAWLEIRLEGKRWMLAQAAQP